jgi:hypothetical protein
METRPILGIIAAILAVTIFLVALRMKMRADRLARLRPADGSDILGFVIVQKTATQPGMRAWTARYVTGTAVDEFAIEMRIAEPVAPSPFAQGSIVFRRMPGSTGAALLRDLSRALGLPEEPTPGSPLDELRCDASFMGSRLTRGDGPDTIAGSFTTTPPGDWIVAKVFFSDGAGEVFLAVNPVSGRGEFLRKDQATSAPVVREFGRLFYAG